MNRKPFFSVIIPTFNRVEKLKKTIQSVLNQTFYDFELLVMDDGSIDQTQVMVDSFGDSRIHYEWAVNSGGPATPRNRGIDKARAEWVCFLDADDLWYPTKLDMVVQAISENHDVDVFCHNEIMLVRDTGRKKLLSYGPFEDNFYQAMLTGGNRLSTSACTVRREFLNSFDLRFNQSKDYVILEDYDLWLRIALNGGRFYFINRPLGEYIIENDNISSNIDCFRHNRNVLLRDHVFQIQSFEPNKEKQWRQIGVFLAVQDAKALFSHGCFSEGMKILISALAKSPEGGVKYIVSHMRKRIRKTRLAL